MSSFRPSLRGNIPLLLSGASFIISVIALTISWKPKSNEIVYVNAQKLLSGYKGTQSAKKEFEAKAATWQANLDTLRLEAEVKIKEYEQQKGRMSVKERALMEEVIQTKQDQFTRYQQTVAERFKTEDEGMTSQVLTRIDDYIKKFGRKHGYAIIMAATQSGNIIYAQDSKDITAEVLEGLNADYSK